MFRIIIFFFSVFIVGAGFCLNKPELENEQMIDFSVQPPYKMSEYEFIKFSNNNVEIEKKKEEKISENKKTDIVKMPEYCKSFSFGVSSNEITEANALILNDFKYRLQVGQKLVVDMYYKKDVEFNERENKRNAVKRSVAIQRYLTNRQVDPAQIFVQIQETERQENANLVKMCIKNI